MMVLHTILIVLTGESVIIESTQFWLVLIFKAKLYMQLDTTSFNSIEFWDDSF